MAKRERVVVSCHFSTLATTSATMSLRSVGPLAPPHCSAIGALPVRRDVIKKRSVARQGRVCDEKWWSLRLASGSGVVEHLQVNLDCRGNDRCPFRGLAAQKRMCHESATDNATRPSGSTERQGLCVERVGPGCRLDLTKGRGRGSRMVGACGTDGVGAGQGDLGVVMWSKSWSKLVSVSPVSEAALVCRLRGGPRWSVEWS